MCNNARTGDGKSELIDASTVSLHVLDFKAATREPATCAREPFVQFSIQWTHRTLLENSARVGVLLGATGPTGARAGYSNFGDDIEIATLFGSDKDWRTTSQLGTAIVNASAAVAAVRGEAPITTAPAEPTTSVTTAPVTTTPGDDETCRTPRSIFEKLLPRREEAGQRNDERAQHGGPGGLDTRDRRSAYNTASAAVAMRGDGRAARISAAMAAATYLPAISTRQKRNAAVSKNCRHRHLDYWERCSPMLSCSNRRGVDACGSFPFIVREGDVAQLTAKPVMGGESLASRGCRGAYGRATTKARKHRWRGS